MLAKFFEWAQSGQTSGVGRERRVLAVASSGGHWIQLMRISPAFEGANTYYVTTKVGDDERRANSRVYLVPNASRTDPVAVFWLTVALIKIIARIRPDVIVTTGAAPGVLALWIGKLFFAKTIWLDSIANAEVLSASGRLAHFGADLRLTQWPHLADTHKHLEFKGAVI